VIDPFGESSQQEDVDRKVIVVIWLAVIETNGDSAHHLPVSFSLHNDTGLFG
jgi:hypothetical protein